MKTLNLIIGIILLLIGGFYTLMPHTVHLSTGLAFGLTHTTHIIIGVIALIIGIIVLLMSKKK